MISWISKEAMFFSFTLKGVGQRVFKKSIVTTSLYDLGKKDFPMLLVYHIQ
jgi:hypothetical protein